MPNIAAVLKTEITRLARREMRSETAKLKKASAQYRSDIAALKRRLSNVEKKLSSRISGKAAAPEVSDTSLPRRFSARSLVAQRKRLGLSAAAMGVLLGVSAQSAYSWETGKSRPRQQQMAAIGAVRRMGKREAEARLKQRTK